MRTTTPRRRLCAGTALAALTLTTACTSASGAADRNAGANARAGRPAAAVSLGDSYSSGEGGRWAGNSTESAGNRAGTDRAAFRGAEGRWRYDPAGRVYDATSYANRCHRSRWSPIRAASLPGVDTRVNLACSGAESKHVRLPGPDGGESFKGEQSQLSRLIPVRDRYDVELITLGIGGNDVGFGDVISGCVRAWLAAELRIPSAVGSECRDEIRDEHLPRVAGMQRDVLETVDQLRRVMREGGYRDDDYRLVLVGYPQPAPGAGDFAQDEAARLLPRCPVRDADAEFVARELIPRINGALANTARRSGAEYLDLTTAFDGHRLCERGTVRGPADGDAPVPAAQAEWVRFADVTLGFGGGSLQSLFTTAEGDQGRMQESFHPNAYGQQAIGVCLTRLYATDPGGPANHRCRGGSSGDADDMVLEPGGR